MTYSESVGAGILKVLNPVIRYDLHRIPTLITPQPDKHIISCPTLQHVLINPYKLLDIGFYRQGKSAVSLHATVLTNSVIH